MLFILFYVCIHGRYKWVALPKIITKIMEFFLEGHNCVHGPNCNDKRKTIIWLADKYGQLFFFVCYFPIWPLCIIINHIQLWVYTSSYDFISLMYVMKKDYGQ